MSKDREKYCNVEKALVDRFCTGQHVKSMTFDFSADKIPTVTIECMLDETDKEGFLSIIDTYDLQVVNEHTNLSNNL